MRPLSIYFKMKRMWKWMSLLKIR